MKLREIHLVASLAAAAVTLTACSKDQTGIDSPTAVLATVIGGNNQSAYVGTQAIANASVRVTDANGDPVTGVIVHFVPENANAHALPDSVATNADGIASSKWSFGTLPGQETMHATIAGVKDSPRFAAVAVAGPATSITVASGNDQVASVGNPSASDLTVKVADPFGNPMAGVPVLFSLAYSAEFQTYKTVVTNVDGLAGTQWSLTDPGATYVMASMEGSPNRIYTLFVMTGVESDAAASALLQPLK